MQLFKTPTTFDFMSKRTMAVGFSVILLFVCFSSFENKKKIKINLNVFSKTRFGNFH